MDPGEESTTPQNDDDTRRKKLRDEWAAWIIETKKM